MDASHSGGSEVARMIWIVGSPIIFSFGIVGNILTMIVLLGRKTRKTSTTVFLTLLALCDIWMIVVALPRWWLIYLFGIEIRHLSDAMCGFLIIIKLGKSGLYLSSAKKERAQASEKSKISSLRSHSTQITVTILLVNTVFLLCETPVAVFMFGRSLWIDQKVGMTTAQEIIWAVCNQLYYINHAINFMMYFLTGSRYRKHVFDLLNCKCSAEISDTSNSKRSAL
ncbi:uncharacterized protein LOC128230657 [Mya arenaria]|uniref:uncharacterized protein LOC128230657 n=1 Tax=Mya arenaria TaxID=6604 RepID=UPI0022E26801|nr:uncharacterized protein LOC128230657 [Mya arenaria]